MHRGLSCFLSCLLVVCSSLFAQSPAPIAAPGLSVPSGSLPYALDRFQEKPELVPVHHSAVEVNNHKGANVAGAIAGSVFYKPKTTIELAGTHARTILHDPTPTFYIRMMEDTDSAGDSPSSENNGFAIVQAVPDKDRRIFAQIRFTQLTGNAKRKDGLIESVSERLPGGWIKLTPKSALVPGEYALSPVPKAQNTFSTVVFDFSLDPSGPNAPDAIPATRD